MRVAITPAGLAAVAAELEQVCADYMSGQESLAHRLATLDAIHCHIEQELAKAEQELAEPSPMRTVKALNREAFKLAHGYQPSDSIADIADDMVYAAHDRAERDCIGYLNAKGDRTPSIHFWNCSVRTVKNHASEELLRWFDENGRITRRAILESARSGRSLLECAASDQIIF